MSECVLTVGQRNRLLRKLNQCKDARHYRRVLAVLEVDRGQSVAEVARRLGISRQSIHNWIRLIRDNRLMSVVEDQPRTGRPSVRDELLRKALRKWLSKSPEDFGYLMSSWAVPILLEQIRKELGKEISDDTLRRELQNLDYSWKRSRYVLAADPDREKKKADPSELAEIGGT